MQLFQIFDNCFKIGLGTASNGPFRIDREVGSDILSYHTAGIPCDVYENHDSPKLVLAMGYIPVAPKTTTSYWRLCSLNGMARSEWCCRDEKDIKIASIEEIGGRQSSLAGC